MLTAPRIFSLLAILPCIFALGCSADAAPEDEPTNEGALHGGESTGPLTAKDFTLASNSAAIDKGTNLVHGSDSPESAQREVALFFGDL